MTTDLMTSEEVKRGIDDTFAENLTLKVENEELRARTEELEAKIAGLAVETDKFKKYRHLLEDPPEYIQIHLRTPVAVASALAKCEDINKQAGRVDAGGPVEQKKARRLLDELVTDMVEYVTEPDPWRKFYATRVAKKAKIARL